MTIDHENSEYMLETNEGDISFNCEPEDMIEYIDDITLILKRAKEIIQGYEEEI